MSLVLPRACSRLRECENLVDPVISTPLYPCFTMICIDLCYCVRGRGVTEGVSKLPPLHCRVCVYMGAAACHCRFLSSCFIGVCLCCIRVAVAFDSVNKIVSGDIAAPLVHPRPPRCKSGVVARALRPATASRLGVIFDALAGGTGEVQSPDTGAEVLAAAGGGGEVAIIPPICCRFR